MTIQKVLFYLGIAISILTAWAGVAGQSFGFSPAVIAAFGFGASFLTSISSAMTSGISGPAHRVAWGTVAISALGAVAGAAGVLGATIARFAALALTTIAAATASGHPSDPNPATR